MPNSDENMALHNVMPKNSRHEHNRWHHLCGP